MISVRMSKALGPMISNKIVLRRRTLITTKTADVVTC